MSDKSLPVSIPCKSFRQDLCEVSCANDADSTSVRDAIFVLVRIASISIILNRHRNIASHKMFSRLVQLCIALSADCANAISVNKKHTMMNL